MEEPAASPPKLSSAYAKRPFWQWLALYAVIGVAVYAAVYYLYLNKKGPGSNPYTTLTPTPTLVVVQQQENPPPVVDTTPEAGVSLTVAGFSPQTLNVKVGTKVVWTNTSGSMGNVSSAPHPVHTDYPPLNLGNFGDGSSISLVFDTPGTYKYHNHLNPSQSGSITVK